MPSPSSMTTPSGIPDNTTVIDSEPSPARGASAGSSGLRSPDSTVKSRTAKLSPFWLSWIVVCTPLTPPSVNSSQSVPLVPPNGTSATPITSILTVFGPNVTSSTTVPVERDASSLTTPRTSKVKSSLLCSLGITSTLANSE